MSESIAASLPVVEVTVHEDRAHITRRGSVNLQAGGNMVRIDAVAPVLVDKTLRALSSGARVTEARVRRRVLAEGDAAAATAALDERIRMEEDTGVALEARRELFEARIEMLQQIADLDLHEAAEDAAWGRLDESKRAETGAELDAAEAAARRALTDLEREVEDYERRLADLYRQRVAAARPTSAQQAAIELSLVAEAAGEVEIEVAYLVPCAVWRPWHAATLRRDRIHLRTDGCVWQNTGEDWIDVALSFATERPSAGLEPPLLSADVLAIQQTGSEVNVQVRLDRVHKAGLQGKGRQAREVPGIDDGGEARLLRATHPATIASDGRPWRVPIFEFDTEVSTNLRLAAEIETAVILRSEQRNDGEHPLLAGPVDLIAHSGRVGRTTVGFVAPGEKFELGWGPDLALRADRSVKKGKDKQRALSSWTRTTHNVTVRLSNIGPDERIVDVMERVPVSEIDRVRIHTYLEATTDGVGPDADGFVRWQVTLAGWQRAERKLAWSLERHDVVAGL